LRLEEDVVSLKILWMALGLAHHYHRILHWTHHITNHSYHLDRWWVNKERVLLLLLRTWHNVWQIIYSHLQLPKLFLH